MDQQDQNRMAADEGTDDVPEVEGHRVSRLIA